MKPIIMLLLAAGWLLVPADNTWAQAGAAATPQPGGVPFSESGLAPALPVSLRPAPPPSLEPPSMKALASARQRPAWLLPAAGAAIGGALFGLSYRCEECWVGRAPWMLVGVGIGAAAGAAGELLLSAAGS